MIAVVRRHATVRYYKRLQPNRLYPMLVVLSTERLQSLARRELEQGASDGVDVLGAYVSSCLGKDWSRNRSIDSRQLPRFSFEAGPKDASVGVRTYQSALNNRWHLIVDVNAPENR